MKLIAQLPFPRVEVCDSHVDCCIIIMKHHRSGWLLQWKVSHRSPDPNDGHLTLGLLLDTEHAFSIIDMGPPADNTEVMCTK